MKTALSLLLLISVGLNFALWSRLTPHREAPVSAEVVESRTSSQDDAQPHSPPTSNSSSVPSADTERELLRLRNEVSQLRKQVGESVQWHSQALEAQKLQNKLMIATQELLHAENALQEMAKMSPADLLAMKDEAYSIRCVNNMKQLALAARIWANDHDDTFPPDVLTMKEEIHSPKVLFCPGDPNFAPATDWSSVNPSFISYRYVNPGGSDLQPEKTLFTCPFHSHVALSDGSVQRR